MSMGVERVLEKTFIRAYTSLEGAIAAALNSLPVGYSTTSQFNLLFVCLKNPKILLHCM